MERADEADLPVPDAYDIFHPFIKGVFSQWHPTPFVVNGERFATAEQWMMACKARLFGDTSKAAAIMATEDPGEQKRHGQMVVGFDQDRWDAAKISIVLAGNLAKFQQNEGALRQLQATAPAMLVEANPRDWIWGVGLAVDDPDAHRPSAWRGSNLLGRVLTRVRDTLSSAADPPLTHG